MKDGSTLLIEDFSYPTSGARVPLPWSDIPIFDTQSESSEPIAREGQSQGQSPVAGECEQRSADLAKATEQTFAAGLAQGIEQGRQMERREQSVRAIELEKRKAQDVAELASRFGENLDNYLRAIEPEVVKLSLSIASRILRRELQVDPLSLAGAVRVALGQLAKNTTVRLRVPAPDVELWTETIARLPNLQLRPAVISDETMAGGDCVLETDMGHADLGIQSQLAETAHGLLDSGIATAAPESLRTGVKNSVC